MYLDLPFIKLSIVHTFHPSCKSIETPPTDFFLVGQGILVITTFRQCTKGGIRLFFV